MLDMESNVRTKETPVINRVSTYRAGGGQGEFSPEASKISSHPMFFFMYKKEKISLHSKILCEAAFQIPHFPNMCVCKICIDIGKIKVQCILG